MTQHSSDNETGQALNPTIEQWLNDRQALLVSYFKIAGLPPYEKADSALPTPKNISTFCQGLLDYISAGHFEIFTEIANESGRILCEQLNLSTDFSLSFNDKYTDNAKSQNFENFDIDLAELARLMEERFDVEDQLLALYLL